jgi:PAS domain S-box-containing protein
MNRMSDQMIDVLPGLVWTMSPDGHIDHTNRRFRLYVGVGFGDSSNEGWEVLIYPNDSSALLDGWRAILNSGKEGELEGRLRGEDGRCRWFNLRLCPYIQSPELGEKWCVLATDIDDRKIGEIVQATRDSQVRMILDGLPSLVAIFSANGAWVEANQQWLKYFGLTTEKLPSIGKFFGDHPDDYERVSNAWLESLKSGRPYEVEGRRRRADGVYRWFLTRAFPLCNASGRIVLWYSLAIDIDDLKRAENFLSGEKRLLELVASGSSMQDILEALCLFVEKVFPGSFCGVVLRDRLGNGLGAGIAPHLSNELIRAIADRAISDDPGPFANISEEKRQVTALSLQSNISAGDQPWRHIALSEGLNCCWSAPIVSSTETGLGAFAIFHPELRAISELHGNLVEQFTHIASIAIERAQADAALKQSETFLARAQQLSHTGSFLWRISDETIVWSDELYRIFEFKLRSPITLQEIRNRVHPEDRPAWQLVIDRALEEGNDFEHDFRLLMPDGSVKYIFTVAHGTKDADGLALEYAGAAQDVTERRISEEALSKVRAELSYVARISSLSTMVATITHEVSQPLSGIITNADTCLRMLRDVPPNIEGALETVHRAIRDGKRASEVISRLRALFVNRGPVEESVDLNEATREVLALMMTELRRNRVVIEPKLLEPLPPIIGDRIQLQQVILNLLRNASDSMSDLVERPRRMIIRTARADTDQLLFSVSDVGYGLQPASATKIFDAFYTTKPSGMGIGLSISRTIIESHHGNIWATSNEGPGATFTFSVPHEPESGGGKYRRKRKREPGNAKRRPG